MKHRSDVNPVTANTEKENAAIDYSEVYRKKEMAQLQKRLRKTRNILFICACAVLGGGLLFWIMPESQFYTRDFFIYVLFASFITILGLFSRKRPYVALLTALLACLAFWGAEILRGTTDDILIGGSIQKLFIISLLISGLHASKEAELIKKELHFS